MNIDGCFTQRYYMKLCDEKNVINFIDYSKYFSLLTVRDPRKKNAF